MRKKLNFLFCLLFISRHVSELYMTIFSNSNVAQLVTTDQWVVFPYPLTTDLEILCKDIIQKV